MHRLKRLLKIEFNKRFLHMLEGSLLKRHSEKKWLESFRVFGIGKEDGKKILRKLGLTLLSEHEKIFGSYWRHTYGPPISLL